MRHRLLFLILSLFLTSSLVADTWSDPKPERYFSKNRRFYIEVVPRQIPEKYYDYHRAKVSGKNLKKFKPSDTTSIACTGTLYKIVNADTIKVWSRQLINNIAPAFATVSDDGKFVCTFDNWANLGYGLDVFVVYNNIGDLLKRYKLDDISPIPLNNYELSISSIWWFCGSLFDDTLTRLSICYIDKDKNKKYRTYNLTKLEFEN